MKPAIENAPPPKGGRPLCPNCGNELRPKIELEFESVEETLSKPLTSGDGRALFGITATSNRSYRLKRRYWNGKYEGYPPFCKMRCGLQFGRAAHKAGFRRGRS